MKPIINTHFLLTIGKAALLQLSICFGLLSPSDLRCQINGELDPTFGIAGSVMTPLGSVSDVAFAIAIQPDGKILAAGLAGVTSVPFNNHFGLARYLPNGDLDASFGINGIVTTNIGNGDDQARAVVVQADGKIIVAGSATNNGNFDVAIVRYLSNGDLDNSFGANGKVVRNVAGGHDVGFAAALQSDGKILVAGSTIINGTSSMLVVRYNTNGTSDNTFDQDGLLAINFSSDFASATCIAVHEDKILLGGYATHGSSKDFALVRLHENGTFDTTFGTGGGVQTTIGTNDDFARGIAVQLDGYIVLTGQGSIGTTRQMASVRYLPNGVIDLEFGADGTGIATTHIHIDEDRVGGILIQPDQKVLIAGSTNDGDSTRHALIRYNTNGTLDATFGTNGIKISTLGLAASYALAVVWDPNGSILTAGGAFNGQDADFLLTRHFNDNTVEILNKAPDESGQITMYPNPCNGTFTIVLPTGEGQVETSILDATGRTVFGPATMNNNRVEIRLDHPAGLYHVLLQTLNGIERKALVIQ